MSAPTVACVLADALAPMLDEIDRQIGFHTNIEIHSRKDGTAFFSAYIHAFDRAFNGIGDTPSEALLKANNDRLKFGEALRENEAA